MGKSLGEYWKDSGGPQDGGQTGDTAPMVFYDPATAMRGEGQQQQGSRWSARTISPDGPNRSVRLF